eukprot:1893336-Prymnesium_polylepis.1
MDGALSGGGGRRGGVRGARIYPIRLRLPGLLSELRTSHAALAVGTRTSVPASDTHRDGQRQGHVASHERRTRPDRPPL